MTNPHNTAKKIIEILEEVRDTFQGDVEDVDTVTLRGFYLCADYGNFDRTGVFLAISADGNGGELTPWAVEGYLSYALRRELFGQNDQFGEIGK